jgi:hypothetical protein
MESHDPGLFSSALQTARDLVHMILTQLIMPIGARAFRSQCAHRRDGAGNGPEGWGHRTNACHGTSWEQNKTPRTRFESQGAQSISPPPSAAQPQNISVSTPSEWHCRARRHHLQAITATALPVLTCIRWRRGISESGDKAQGSRVWAFAASPIERQSRTQSRCHSLDQKHPARRFRWYSRPATCPFITHREDAAKVLLLVKPVQDQTERYLELRMARLGCQPDMTGMPS